MAPFIYTPLKEPKTEIRLFELFPGRGRLQGRLYHSELEAVKGTYDALSYCWGEQTKSVAIVVNHCTWSISENLYTALKSVRRQHQGRLTMWIDALCINQDDTQEKNAQVAIMRDIYFNGRRTYVWLGPHDVWTALAFKEMKMRAAWERKHDKGRAEVGWWQWRQMHTGFQEENHSEDADALLTRLMARVPCLGWPAKRALFLRPWFSRCWVVQEIATSMAITMVCGKYHIDWSDMETAFQGFSQSGYDEICTLISIRQSFHNSKKSRLETLLWRTNTFQTTDPRDRIFSLLGLVSQDAETASDGSPYRGTWDGMRADYGASIRDVYIEATLQCLIRTGRAGILAASLGLRRTSVGDFPSWVLNPAPSREDPQGNNLFAWAVACTDSRAKMGGWTAARSSKCQPELDRQNNLLGLQGIIVDIVDLVGAEREGFQGSPKVVRLHGMAEHAKTGAGNIKCYFQWRAFAGVGADEFYRGTTKTTEQAFLEIMCPRMPTADENDAFAAERHWQLSRQFDRFVTSTFPFMEQRIHGKLRKRELAWIVAQSARVVGEASLGKRENVAAAADFEANDSFSSSRRFVKTRKGYIGLGGRHVAVGDSVVILAGSAAPFLLRPSSPGRYQVVSDAYFVQMMDGELWDPKRCGMIWLE